MPLSLNDMLEKLADELPNCQHTSVIDGRTGLALVAKSKTNSLDAAGADAYHSDLYRLSKAALQGMPIADETEELVLTTREATFVSIPVGDTGYLWLVVTTRDATLGFIQAMMRKHVSKVQESLQDLV